MNRRRILTAAVLIVALTGIFSLVWATGTATLTWTPPTTYTDGTAIPAGAIVKYTVYRGVEPRVYTFKLDVGKVNTYPLYSLPSGTHYFSVTVTTVDGAVQTESDYSNEGSKFIPASKPGACVLQVQ